MRVTSRKFTVILQDVLFPSHLRQFIDDIIKHVNDRVDASTEHRTVTPGVANTEFRIMHNLGYIPDSYIVTSQNVAGSLYRSQVAWTKTTAYFKFSGVSADVKVLIW